MPYPKARFAKGSGVVDNSGIHKAKAGERWLAELPRFVLLFLPTYCPQANLIERAFGAGHAKCTRNPQRHRIAELVGEVAQPLASNGPWQYQLSHLSYTPAITTAVERIAKELRFSQAA